MISARAQSARLNHRAAGHGPLDTGAEHPYTLVEEAGHGRLETTPNP